MSPPEVWGPAVWRLFHKLAININENLSETRWVVSNFLIAIGKPAHTRHHT